MYLHGSKTLEVYLIYPRSPGATTEQWNLSWYGDLLGRRVVAAPPLGPAILAACTPPGVSITAVDENISEVNLDARPDLVAISFHTASSPRAYELAAHFRHQNIPVVLGGIHASMLPGEALLHSDFVVTGEAEQVWPCFLKDFMDRRPVRLYHGNTCPPEAIPIPRWDIFPSSSYLSHSLQASRGCRFDCDFCVAKAFSSSQLRLRPVEMVIQEIRLTLNNDANKTFAISDNDILADEKWTTEFIKGIKPLSINWTGYTSQNILNHPELLYLIADSGCLTLVIGFETLNPQGLQKVNKYANQIEKYQKVVEMVQKAGIGVVGSFVFGLDGDTPDIFKRTADFIEETHLLLVNLNILTPYPGTRLYHRLECEGRLIHRDWKLYDRRHACHRPVNMSPQELEEGFNWLERKVYHPHSFSSRLCHFLAHSRGASLNLPLSPTECLMTAWRCLLYLPPPNLGLLAKMMVLPGMGAMNRRMFYTFAGMRPL